MHAHVCFTKFWQQSRKKKVSFEKKKNQFWLKGNMFFKNKHIKSAAEDFRLSIRLQNTPEHAQYKLLEFEQQIPLAEALAVLHQLCLYLEELTPVHGTEPPNRQEYQKMAFAQKHHKAKAKKSGERSPNSFFTRIYQSKLSLVTNYLQTSPHLWHFIFGY